VKEYETDGYTFVVWNTSSTMWGILHTRCGSVLASRPYAVPVKALKVLSPVNKCYTCIGCSKMVPEGVRFLLEAKALELGFNSRGYAFQ